MVKSLSHYLLSIIALLCCLPSTVCAQTGGANIFSGLDNGRVKQAASPKLSPQNEDASTTIYGCVNYNRSEDKSKYGVYSIKPEANARLQEVFLTDHSVANGGGVFLDGHYKFVNYDETTGTATYYDYDTSNWRQVKKETLPDLSNCATDEAYDPTTGNIYGCFVTANGNGYVFGKVDHDTHVRTEIAPLRSLLFAVAVTPDGTVYGISADGYLLQIDKTTGSTRTIGSTGLFPKYNQSAICDPKTGRMYWAAVQQDASSGLYEVNLQSGRATMITRFGGNEGLVGLYIPFDRANADAPGAATNLTASFEGSSTSGSLSFKMPTVTYGGSPLTGSLRYKVTVNNNEVAAGNANAGEDITTSFNGIEGMNEIIVTTSNDAGTGAIAKTDIWGGYDTPNPPTNVVLTKTDETHLHLSWNAPQGSVHNGYVDTTDMKYKVVRYPGGTTISTGLRNTELNQTVRPKEFTNYWYTVTATSQKKESAAAASNKVAMGGALNVPYFDDFSNTNNWNNYTIVDANNDGNTWQGPDDENKNVRYNSSFSDEANDWLITPAFQLDKTKAYKVYFRAQGADATHEEHFSVAAGKSNSPESMTIQVLPEQIIKTSAPEEYVGYLTIPDDGAYFVGIHALNNNKGQLLTIDSLGIEEGPLASVPDSVTELKVIAAPNGADSVTVSFKAPEHSLNGNAITSLTKITIERDGNVIYTFNNVQPGEALSYTDKTVGDGKSTYTVTATNASGDGLAASATLFVGSDIPTAPTDVRLREAEGYTHLTWKAPTTGENDGYINPSELTYIVLRSDNTIVAQGITATEYDDADITLDGDQHLVQYAVYASTNAGQGSYGLSNAITIGTPYELPFQEHFTGGGLDHGFWGENYSGQSYFRLSSSSSSDDAGGCATLTPAAVGDESTLYSGKIGINVAAQPQLAYHYMAIPGRQAKLLIEILTPDQQLHQVDSIDFSTLTGEQSWRKRTVDLSDYNNENFVQICFHAISGDGSTPISVDDITLRDLFNKDLGCSINSHKKLTAGANNDITVTVENTGAETVNGNDYSVILFDQNDKELGKLDGETLQSSETRDFTFNYVPGFFGPAQMQLHAEINYQDDEDDRNNITDTISVKVEMPNLPKVSDLKATTDGNQTLLTWTPADLESLGLQTVTDDAEDYDAFSISEIGDWTMYDGDGQMTFGISDGNGGYRAYPNAIDPKSFIVFNAPESGVSVYDSNGRPTKWAPYSGNQMFISFQASGTGITDDWMISPELQGFAQAINFWVKSVDVASNGNETYEVLYSTTDNDPNSFTRIGNEQQAPADWSNVRFDLPEGTKYFAIRGTSVGHFALMIDDITYATANFADLQLLGFNIYMNGEKVNQSPVASPSYTANLGNGEVRVSAVYDKGESEPCDAIKIGTADGINAISIDDIANYELYTIDGIKVSRVNKGGVYIIRQNGHAHKVVIK